MSNHNVATRPRQPSKAQKNRVNEPVRGRKALLGDGLRASYPLVLLDLLETLDCPKAVAIAIAIRNWDGVTTEELKNLLSCNYRNYKTVWDYKVACQAVALVKKTAMFPLRYDASNLEGYYKSSETNARRQAEMLVSRSYSFESVTLLNRVRSIMLAMLGTAPCSVSDARFGPGSTYLRKGNDSHIIAKLQNVPECTPLAHDTVYRILIDRPHYVMSYSNCNLSLPIAPLKIVPGDRLSLVPKDIFKPRVMCPQPTGNMYYQLGLSDIICKRFHRFTGYDLLLASDTHRALVSYAYDAFGTIDLSDASDSISLKLLEFVLPPDWFNLVRNITCRQTLVGKKWFPNQKAFAQGCGITFPMETALFYAIAYATVESELPHQDPKGLRNLISVFGDDIIVPIHCQAAVCKALESVCFVVNNEKSYGLLDTFKESCGTDTINGVNVRPIYFKEFEARQVGINILANSICDVSRFLTGEDAVRGTEGFYLSIFNRARNRCIGILKKCDMEPIFVPASFERTDGIWARDGYLITFRGGRRAIRICYQKSRSFRIPEDPYTALAAALSGVSSEGYNIRGRVTTQKRWRIVYDTYQPLLQY